MEDEKIINFLDNTLNQPSKFRKKKMSWNKWTLEFFLLNCEVNLVINWFENCIIVYNDVANQGVTFSITETKIYVPVLTLSTQGITNLLQQLKSGFKRRFIGKVSIKTRVISTKSKFDFFGSTKFSRSK